MATHQADKAASTAAAAEEIRSNVARLLELLPAAVSGPSAEDKDDDNPPPLPPPIQSRRSKPSSSITPSHSGPSGSRPRTSRRLSLLPRPQSIVSQGW